jgi:hypothetical protein
VLKKALKVVDERFLRIETNEIPHGLARHGACPPSDERR